MSNGDSSPLHTTSGLGHPHLRPPGSSAVLSRQGAEPTFLSATAGKGAKLEAFIKLGFYSFIPGKFEP